MEVILLAAILVAVAFLALGFNILFRKEGKFPETEVGRNRQMSELGITCPLCDERKKRSRQTRKKDQKINPLELKIDTNQLQ
jgi:hypothetical protein